MGQEPTVSFDQNRIQRNWGPRTRDVDVLLVGDLKVNEPDLVVPHPRMWERDFVLRPLADLAVGSTYDAIADRYMADALKDTVRLRRARAYLMEPGCNVLLGRANLDRAKRKYSFALLQLRRDEAVFLVTDVAIM